MVDFAVELRKLLQFAGPRLLGISSHFSVTWSAPERIRGVPDLFANLVWVKDENGKKFSGFAVDSAPARLVVKAMMESLESLALEDAGLKVQSRTGVAAHFDEASARDSAYMELIERDAFLFHWLTERPGVPLGLGLESLTQSLHSVRLISLDANVEVVLTASKSSTFGCWHLGVGASRSLSTAYQKSYREWAGSIHCHEVAQGCQGSAKLISDDFLWHHQQSKDHCVSALLEYIVAGSGGKSLATSAQIFFQPDGNLDVFSATHFTSLPVRSQRYRVEFAENSRCLPLFFGDRYKESQKKYLKILRDRDPIIFDQSEDRRFFHPRALGQDEPLCFLPHPFD